MAAKFIPRQFFPNYGSIPRSYYLGHHRAGLKKMKNMLSSVDYVVECRDYRVPVTFWINRTAINVSSILKHLREDAEGPDKIVGCRVMVVGMPNVGKSTLINNLRNQGVGKAKAVQTGGQPGITRKIGSPVKIIERMNGSHVYVLDTPGVFMPYVPDAENMLKLALCGCVKDSVISPVTLADYLLYHINLHDAQVYERWSPPTNEIMSLLNSFARYSGHLAKGGIPNIDLAAQHFIQKWRSGSLGRFLLDDLQAEERHRQEGAKDQVGISITQALRAERKSKKRDNPSCSKE
ncbi:hypothetical protein EYZ11_008070 [Aspergillus tanneri]|uniref:G domain-containing protein n=1 Tax=Aspergillus tanneri TaxID=1220188 RepID=A0A4V3UNT7_9EURO|nr:hypothetical protein EYZ11_008070 [Aspergillus tanneri]